MLTNNRYPVGCMLGLAIITIMIGLGSCGPNLTYCDRIPLNKLTNCNVTCATCRSVDQCSTCPDYLTLASGKCMVPTGENMYVTSYFNGTNLKRDRDLLYFYNALGTLSSDDVIRFCAANKYKFDSLGLFNNAQYLTFTQQYGVQASEIALNFRLFYSTSVAILKIQINSKIVFNATYQAGFDLNYTVNTQTDAKGMKWSLAIVETDPSAYIDQLFAPIRTGMVPLASTTAIIKITVQNGLTGANSTYQNFWGISDLTVITKKCKSCISTTIKKFGQVLGIVMAISFGVVAILLLILYIYSRIKNANYKQNLKKRFHDGTKNSTLPSQKLSTNSDRQLN